MASDQDRHRHLRNVAARSGVAAAVAGSAVALDAVTGIPIGSALLPIVGPGAEDVLTRALSSRQRNRVERLLSHAADAYQKMAAEGKRLRDDDFFQDRDGRWSSEEVVEAALLAASNEPQELKLPYLGHLLAAIAVFETVDVPSAHWVLEQARALTWTQYVQLAIIGADPPHDLPDADIAPVGKTWEEYNATDQLADLGYGRRGMIAAPRAETPLAKLPVPNTKLSEQRLQNSGTLLHALLGLKNVPHDIQAEHIALLTRALVPDPGPPAEDPE